MNTDLDKLKDIIEQLNISDDKKKVIWPPIGKI